MKIARFEHEGTPTYGALDEARGEFVLLQGDPVFQGLRPLESERVSAEGVKLLAPVIPRSKVVGYMYQFPAGPGDVARDEPVFFVKPNTSVIGPDDTIVIPAGAGEVRGEAEIAVVIGAMAKNVRAEDAASVIFGYTVANDVTAADVCARDGQWARGKGFDTFCPLGPYIQTMIDPASTHISSRVNGEDVQSGEASDMFHPISELVAHASRAFTLLPGDVILTGAPAPQPVLENGDVMECEVEGIGVLRNPVRRLDA